MEIQWSLVLFAAFICWGAGTYLATVAFYEAFGSPDQGVRPAFVFSGIAVVIGAVASMTHLGHLDRIFGVLTNPSSGIFVEGLSSALLVLLVIVYLVAAARKASRGALRAVALVGCIPALVVVIAVGSSYLMVARPAWDIIALPIVSLTAALSMGGVTALFFSEMAPGATNERATKLMTTTTLGLVALQAVGVIAYAVSVAAAPYQEASRSVERILAGDLALLFWIAVVALGIVVPFIAVYLQRRTGQTASGGTASASSSTIVLGATAVCMAIAVVAFRVIMFSLGSSIIDFGFTV